jgi:hypothetical protein
LVGEITLKAASRPTGVTVNVALRAAPPKLAVIVTGDEAPTVDVVIVNVALVCPPGTDTVAGTWATRVLLLWSCTVTPLGGAEVVSVTVPVGIACPTTDD